MSIRETVIAEFEKVRLKSKEPARPLMDGLVLLDSGVDSLGLAILVTRLEDILGVDPFTDSDITIPPVSLGEFVQLYECAGKSRCVNQGRAE
jgi:acyl carrier protein